MDERPQKLRVIAICLFTRGESILVFEGVDDSKAAPHFYRPLGGGVEAGERTDATVVREIEEELGQCVGKLRLVGVLENLFTYQGRGGHEIVFVYDGEFADATLYTREALDFIEGDETGTARWLPLSFFNAQRRLVPHGLKALILRDRAARSA